MLPAIAGCKTLRFKGSLTCEIGDLLSVDDCSHFDRQFVKYSTHICVDLFEFVSSCISLVSLNKKEEINATSVSKC